MDKRDLLNMLRHAFLIGFNEGHLTGKDDMEKPFDDRDDSLNALIDDYEKEGYCSYNDDVGSHICDKECQ